MKKTKPDEVNAPAHYQILPGVEAIDIMRAVLTPEEFKGYCKGCALKYQLRCNKKHESDSVDIGKAEKYLSFINEGHRK